MEVFKLLLLASTIFGLLSMLCGVVNILLSLRWGEARESKRCGQVSIGFIAMLTALALLVFLVIK